MTGFAACDPPIWLAVKTTSLDDAMRARTRFSQQLNLRVFQQYLRIRPTTGSEIKLPSAALATTIDEAVRQPGRTRDARSLFSRNTTLSGDRRARAGRSTRRRSVAPNHSAAAIRARIWPDRCPSSSNGSCWECNPAVRRDHGRLPDRRDGSVNKRHSANAAQIERWTLRGAARERDRRS